MRQFLSSEVAQKANKWQGRNITPLAERGVRRDLCQQPTTELDPVKRAALLIE